MNGDFSLTLPKEGKSCPFAQRQQLSFITYRPHSTVHLQESYENLGLVLIKIAYTAHDSMICGDLNVLCMLLGRQAGYTQYPCSMCEWDSRERSQRWNTGHQELLLNLGARIYCAKVLSIRRKYCCHPLILN
jgi:hypothetical protein